MDTEKVEKARNGNVDEIGNLLMENMKSMYRVAFSILKTEEEISDAISNTTVIVFEKIHTLKNAEFFKTWLIRILINECNKIHRQNKKIIYLENYNQTDLVYNDKYDDFGVRQAIKKLDEDLKTMVILYYFEDFNIKEISEIQKLPEGTVKSGKDGQYKLKFKQNIPDNTIVKLQYVKDKITKDSWAYQTSNKLSVTNTYPANRADRVLTSSNIEIEMSYSNIENFEKYVQIVPEVEGTWEQKGKVYRFIPSNGLVDQTQYTVTVKKGLKIYDQELEDNYTFSFSVNNDTGITEKYENISNSIDNINTYNSNENISIYYQTNGNIEIANVEIGKFDSSDSFIEYLQTKDYSKATDLQKVDFNLIENGIRLTRTLQDGYYVAIIKNKNDSELFNTPIQINNLNAYVTNTENDILVWVADENGIASR